MGEGIMPSSLTVVDEEGRMFELESCEINVVEGPELACFDENSTFKSKSYEANISYKGISRKRFIKLLMAMGMGSAGANEIAKYCHKKYGTYSPTFLMLM